MAYIHTIQTAVPENHYAQDYARDFMKKHIGGEGALSRIIHRIYAMSGIEKRHCVITDFQPASPGGLFFDADKQVLLNPQTGDRNQFFASEAGKMFTKASEKALDVSGFERDEITDVITVSCTGFYNPGPDYQVVRHLGLSPHTRRYHLGFMGCYAAFPAMKMAQSICAENPGAVVLVTCAELCTLHLQFSKETDAIISASVFADGAASMVISAREPNGSKPALSIQNLSTVLVPEGEKDMAWTIGNNGFDMVLSTYVPDIIESNLETLLTPFFQNGIDPGRFRWWAVHPGGRAILDKVQQALGLGDDSIAPSRHVLSQYGNMSSATILFVLKEIMERGQKNGERVFSMAFGPGLTIETGIFDVVLPDNAIKPKPETHAVVPA